jgi:hypothetical protein
VVFRSLASGADASLDWQKADQISQACGLFGDVSEVSPYLLQDAFIAKAPALLRTKKLGDLVVQVHADLPCPTS